MSKKKKSSDDAGSIADGLGFTREARGGEADKRLCLSLMIYVSDEMKARGVTGDVHEFRRQYERVLNGKRECPLAATCPKYRRAIERGAKMVYPKDGDSRNRPVQLALWG
ncbi:MAG: hypothetical protein JW850_19105 [Thermoflexales bacterium]|nr:hypothetical protein [Thermoflexales bacterium]